MAGYGGIAPEKGHSDFKLGMHAFQKGCQCILQFNQESEHSLVVRTLVTFLNKIFYLHMTTTNST